jgi:hypothetical protein
MAAPRKKHGLSRADPLGGSSGAGEAKEALRKIFQRNGYIRVPRDERRRELGARYKKGWEVRLILKSPEELDEAGRLLASVNLQPGRPFMKSRQYALPIYGRKAVDFFTTQAVTG